MKFLQESICRVALSLLSFACLSIMPIAKIEAHDHHHDRCHDKCHDQNHVDPQALGLQLELSLGLAVQNHDVQAFSRMISNIFQGLTPGGIFNRDGYITVLTNTDIVSFELHNLIAKEDHNVLTVSYNVTSINSIGVTHNNNVVSVWQKVERRDCHSHCDPCGCDHDVWLLVSQNTIPIIEG